MGLCGVCHSCMLCPTVWVTFSTSGLGGERESEFVFPLMCLGCGLAPGVYVLWDAGGLGCANAGSLGAGDSASAPSLDQSFVCL